MTENIRKRGKTKSQWVGLLITTFLGIAATIGVGWYQLAKAEKQAYLAEQERSKNIQESLISIVEEHILNSKPIELGRLARLIDQRRREYNVRTSITVSDIIEKSEFNILNSRYLSFEKKEAIKPIFNELYKEQSRRKFHEFDSEIKNADLLNELAKNIQDKKTSEALEFLMRLQEAHLKDLEALSLSKPARSLDKLLNEIIETIGNNPLPVIVLVSLYGFFFFVIVDRKSPFRKILLQLFEKRIETEKEKSSDPDCETKESANKANSADAKSRAAD